VLSDATPDSAWKPGAQYAANEPPPGIGHNQGPPLEDPPEIPKITPPFNTRILEFRQGRHTMVG